MSYQLEIKTGIFALRIIWPDRGVVVPVGNPYPPLNSFAIPAKYLDNNEPNRTNAIVGQLEYDRTYRKQGLR